MFIERGCDILDSFLLPSADRLLGFHGNMQFGNHGLLLLYLAMLFWEIG